MNAFIPRLETFSRIGGGFRSNVGRLQPGFELTRSPNPLRTGPGSDVNRFEFGGDIATSVMHMLDVARKPFQKLVGIDPTEIKPCDILDSLAQ